MPHDMVTIAQPATRLVDPHDCTDARDALSLLGGVFDTLVRRRDQGFAPGLATAWSVSEDAAEWTFEMRRGVVFHDGTPFTADIAAQSLHRMARPDKGYTLGAPGVWHQYLGGAQIVADGGTRLVVRLHEPIADFLDILAQGFIAAPSTLAALDGDAPALPCGTGPYRITSACPEAVEAERVETHFRGTPANRHLRWIAEPDRANRLALLRSGAAQGANDLDFNASLGLDTDRFTRTEYLDPCAIIYLLNVRSQALADPRVRRALNLAIDRAALIASIRGGAARPLDGIISPIHFGACTDRPLVTDRPGARALLADAGFADGMTLAVDCPTRLPDEAQAMTSELARQLATIGVRLEVRTHPDREAYAHMVRRKEIGDLCVFDSSPLSTFRVLHEKIDSRIAGSWWQGYRNPAVEALLDQARRCTQERLRAGLYQEVYRILQDDPPWLTLYNPVRVAGIAGRHPAFAMPTDGVLDVAALPAL